MELSLCASSTVRLCLSLGFGRGMDMGEQGFLATSPSSTAWFMIWESFWWTRCSLLSVAPSLRIPWNGKVEKPAVVEKPHYDPSCQLCPGRCV